jgi:hypothetical protein
MVQEVRDGLSVCIYLDAGLAIFLVRSNYQRGIGEWILDESIASSQWAMVDCKRRYFSNMTTIE